MTQIDLEIDDNVLESAKKACEDIGISLDLAITIFLNELIEEHRIPFEYDENYKQE